MTLPPYWHEAKTYLSKKDKRLKRLIESYAQEERLRNLQNAFHTLARSIVGQQISVKAADSVWAKLEALLTTLEPEQVALHSDEALRACGLSGSKVAYLRNVPTAFIERQVTPHAWGEMDDAAIAKQLTAIKGIGQWTAEMFLIFHLHRPDIWPINDLGVVKGVEKLIGAKEKLTKSQLQTIAEPWRPYRTVVTWYLWRSLDPVAIQY
jgi:DNA-3-methyladenine glycosylase II